MENQLTRFADLTRTIQSLTNITTRAYHGVDKFAFHSRAPYPDWLQDPFDRHLDKLEGIEDKVACIRTNDNFYYGVILRGEYKVVIGPVQDPAIAEEAYERAASEIMDDPAHLAVLISMLRDCPRMNLNSMLAMVLSTENMLSFSDSSTETDLLDQRIFGFVPPKVSYYNYQDEKAPHLREYADSFIGDMVRQGDIDGMEDWMVNPLFSAGKLPLSEESLRSAKNNFIVVAAILSMTALNAGMSRKNSGDLLVRAIQNAEKMNSENEVLKLLSDLAKQYTREVHDLQAVGGKGMLAAKAVSYIRSHINTPLRTEQIAKALYVSRSHLSQAFSEETGQPLGKFIQDEKIKEAKSLISNGEMSLSQISSQLCFSSQSYFTRIFKEHTGLTPKEYRDSRQMSFEELRID